MIPMWLALIFSVLPSRISNLTLPDALSSNNLILPVPRSFHSPASLSKRYNLQFLRRDKLVRHINHQQGQRIAGRVM